MKPRGNRPWAMYINDTPRTNHPTRRGWIATEDDVTLATIAKKEFESQRLRVQLTLPEIPDGARRLRTAISSNPGWYRMLVHRRPVKGVRTVAHGKRVGGKHSIRQYVARALRRIIEEKYIRPNAIDAELLEVLHQDPNLGR